MGIRGTALFSIFTVVIAIGASVAACGSSSASTDTSGSGQSCTRTADCSGTLVCMANVCLAPSSTSTSKSDAGVAATGDAGDAATGTMGPHLGLIGEACQTTADCATGYDCVASSVGPVCDIVDYNLTATGKTCTGECSSTADCCEVPTTLGSIAYTPDGGFLTALAIHGCQDLLTVLGGDATVCATGGSGPTGLGVRQACFYYQAYCQCAANTWACTNSKCQYTAPCQANTTNTLGGCPTATRAGAASSTTCNLTTNSCLPATCSAASDCVGKPVTDVAGATCAGSSCTCSNMGCYLKCAKDLDCAAGYTCDMATSLCAVAQCATDGDCVTRTNNVRAQCSAGACKIPCVTDHDCGSSGDLPGTAFSQQVCGSGNFCQPVGCMSDNDCTTSAVHMYCITPPATGERSAVTN